MKIGSWRIGRRSFLVGSAFTSAMAANLLSQSRRVNAQAPALITSDKLRPTIPYGVASGDITDNRATIWSRCDRPAQTILEYSTDESFRNVIRRVTGSEAVEDNDFTVKVNLWGLPPGEQIFYRVTFQDLNNTTASSVPAIGTFRTAPAKKRDIRFVWSGDNAGQGWGINPEFGGMKIFETMRQLNPDFFIHSGDTIYADNPILAEVKLDDGSIWKNITTPEKSKVAETLAEFRGNYIYNLLDENVRRFNAQVPQLVQWDDHETTNNWYPGEILTNVGTDARYTIKDVNVLAARARQAFLEYQPIRFHPKNPRIYRSFQYGSMLDIFMLDERSYRGPNSTSRSGAGVCGLIPIHPTAKYS